MDTMLHDLLEAIAGVDDEEDLILKLTQAVWKERSLELSIEASLGDQTEPGVWTLHCEHVLASKLVERSAFSLELVDDHPTLWPFKYPSASAFFSGVPENSEACVGALYEAHERATGSWLPFGFEINGSSRLSELLDTGNGLLARASVPLLEVYKAALQPHGVEISIVSRHQPTHFDGFKRQQTIEADVLSLLLGGSYVVGIGWTAYSGSGDTK